MRTWTNQSPPFRRTPEEETMALCTPVRRRRPRTSTTAALLVGLMLTIPWTALAQDEATPEASAGPIMSQARDEVQAEINVELRYSEAATPGGTFIDANTGDSRTIHPLLAEDEDSLAVVSLLY